MLVVDRVRPGARGEVAPRRGAAAQLRLCSIEGGCEVLLMCATVELPNVIDESIDLWIGWVAPMGVEEIIMELDVIFGLGGGILEMGLVWITLESFKGSIGVDRVVGSFLRFL